MELPLNPTILLYEPWKPRWRWVFPYFEQPVLNLQGAPSAICWSTEESLSTVCFTIFGGKTALFCSFYQIWSIWSLGIPDICHHFTSAHFSCLESKKKVPKNEDAKKGIMYHFGQTTTQPVKSISSFIIVSSKKWQVFLCPQPEVYSSRTGYMPEAPKCIQPKFPKL